MQRQQLTSNHDDIERLQADEMPNVAIQLAQGQQIPSTFVKHLYIKGWEL